MILPGKTEALLAATQPYKDYSVRPPTKRNHQQNNQNLTARRRHAQSLWHNIPVCGGPILN
jgi:hypothetical protein